MAIQAQLCSDSLGFSLTNPPQDLITMENHHNNQNSCGLNNQFSFNNLHLLQQQHMQYNHHMMSPDQSSQQIVYHDTNQNLATMVEKQRLELDRFISLQRERLRWALQEQRRQQVGLILNKYERKTQFLLKQKEEEITKAASRTMELRDFLKRMEMEKEAWQRLAKEKEVMVLSLNNTIEQLRESGCLLSSGNGGGGGVEDAESCCDAGGIEPPTTELQQQQQPKQHQKMICRGCNSRCSCIIIIPCRHLCLCNSCQLSFDSCPVCGVQKKAIIEALI